ncbi:hypothetical protein ACIP4Y_05645 [Streptomyces sp. NPDC088810]
MPYRLLCLVDHRRRSGELRAPRETVTPKVSETCALWSATAW